MIINPFIENKETVRNTEAMEDSKNIFTKDQLIAKVYKEIMKDFNGINEKSVFKEKIKKHLYERHSIFEEQELESMALEIYNKIFEYGILQKLIEDNNVTDIRVVNHNKIYVKRNGKWECTEETFTSKSDLEEYIRFCALKNNASINLENPAIVFTDKEKGLRIEAGIEPINIISPSLVIRIHRKRRKLDLEELLTMYNMLDKESYLILKAIMNSMPNIVLCGKGGSGKTTLLKALISEIPKEIAITSNEETSELYLTDRNVIQRECILNRQNGKNIDLERLSKQALVMSNDVIIIGEIKGSEASNFFDAVSTGHMGLATLHCNCVENVISRIITLMKKDIRTQSYKEAFLEKFLTTSLDYIIFLKEFKINQIAKVKYDSEKGKIIYERLLKKEDE